MEQHVPMREAFVRLSVFLSSGSEKDWLGSGVYFYDNNREGSYTFCKSVKRIADEDIVVVTATIDSVFYFNLLEMEHYNLFSELVKRFRERVSKLKKSYLILYMQHLM